MSLNQGQQTIRTDVRDVANAVPQAKARNSERKYDWDNAEVVKAKD